MAATELDDDHLEWLVNGRFATQSVAVKLHRLLRDYGDQIRAKKEYMLMSQALIAVSFSLWRAVFLSDKKVGYRNTLEHGFEFLEKVILDNAIGYNQDRNARNWTFNYYVNNAKYRLEDVATQWPQLLSASDIRRESTPKEHWENHQQAFSTAVTNFDNLLKET